MRWFVYREDGLLLGKSDGYEYESDALNFTWNYNRINQPEFMDAYCVRSDSVDKFLLEVANK